MFTIYQPATPLHFFSEEECDYLFQMEIDVNIRKYWIENYEKARALLAGPYKISKEDTDWFLRERFLSPGQTIGHDHNHIYQEIKTAAIEAAIAGRMWNHNYTVIHLKKARRAGYL